MRVAILGASGFGRYHVREFSRLGCKVASILGSGTESSVRTSKEIKKLYSVDARPYCNLEEMLDQERLDAVSICTPPKNHYRQVKACLDKGLDILCEKPFVSGGLMKNYLFAKELVDLAKEKGSVLKVNTQWMHANPVFSMILKT